jgi:dipeptidyl aminopeptidase/acylaminoacyl peptidase
MSTEMTITKAKPTSTSTPTATATPQEIEKIAYAVLEDKKPVLWTMNNDGTGRLRLTPLGTSSWFPLWSPNGKLLAFLSNMKDGKMNLFAVKKGTSEFIQLTDYADWAMPVGAGLKSPFSWSPKSDEIAYAYKNSLWKVNLDTLNHETLSTQDPAFSVVQVEWAPHRDNKFVAFLVRKGSSHFSLRLSNPRLHDELKLAETSVSISDITWSADAREVAYITDHDSVFSASSERSLPKPVLVNQTIPIGDLLTYSPSESGNLLMFLAKKTPNEKAYRVALVDKPSKDETDPGTVKFLTEPGVEDAIFSPDGGKIAYVQNGELWVMDAASGAHKTRLAAIAPLQPCWSKK